MAGLEDLVFRLSGDTIYDPQTLISGSPIVITVTNLGEETISGLGLYIVPATTIGDVDYPADYPPETDYQDLIRWGEETEQGVAVDGGLRVTLPQNPGGDVTSLVRRVAGSLRSNKLRMKDLAPNESLNMTLSMTTPPAVVARRAYISIILDIDT